MNLPINSNDPCSAGYVPSDDDLITYLLGSQSTEVRQAIEQWLASDVAPAARLDDVAATVLFASTASADWSTELVTHRSADVSTLTASRFRQVVVVSTLAASIALALFTFRIKSGDSISASRLAMAWAESLPSTSDSDTDFEDTTWLLDQGVQLDSPYLANANDLNTDELAESSTAFGFASEEPPEWLLAAVLAMQANDLKSESAEALP